MAAKIVGLSTFLALLVVAMVAPLLCKIYYLLRCKQLLLCSFAFWDYLDACKFQFILV